MGRRRRGDVGFGGDRRGADAGTIVSAAPPERTGTTAKPLPSVAGIVEHKPCAKGVVPKILSLGRSETAASLRSLFAARLAARSIRTHA